VEEQFINIGRQQVSQEFHKDIFSSIQEYGKTDPDFNMKYLKIIDDAVKNPRPKKHPNNYDQHLNPFSTYKIICYENKLVNE
jgi:hypothetical protein